MATACAAVLADNGPQTVSPTDATQLRARGPARTGHQLIVPYYTVQNGNATLLNIVNADLQYGKAVKVRFRGAGNADSVFDFQLYLSPGDVWAATVARGADGRAVLTTTDKSCTLPAGVGAGGSGFLTGRLPASMTAAELAAQTREGYVEIVTMADIHPLAAVLATGAVSTADNPLYNAIQHVAGVPPCSVAALNRLAVDPPAATGVDGAYDLGLRAPTTGLLANWIIINVPLSGAASGEAISVVAAAASNQPARGNIVFSPQTGAVAATPNLHTADPAFRTIAGAANGDVQNGAGAAYTAGTTPILTALMLDFPDLSTPYARLDSYPSAYAAPLTQANNLSTALATFLVQNEYLTDTTITAATDWVLAQPTRRYHVTLDYRPGTPDTFARAFNASAFYGAASTRNEDGLACAVTSGLQYFDREALTAISDGGAVPSPPPRGLYFCGAVSVMTFNTAGASALGAELTRRQITTGLVQSGWATIATPGATNNGIPMIGRSFIRATNPAVTPGIAANFGGGFEHRYVPLIP
ncbi:MAG: cell surface protein [Haliea sp.]|nr:MAG: cell surface protein [Haliea sp.]